MEEVAGVDTSVQLSEAGLQPSVQLRVDVELPEISWLLHLWGEREEYNHNRDHLLKTLPSGSREVLLCYILPLPLQSKLSLTFSTTFEEVTGSVAW